jgi:SAM-dependent methyltransferase
VKDDSIKTEEKLSESYWWFVGRRAIVESLLRRLVKRSRVAVDVGCGSGGNLPLLSRYSERVIGLDRSPVALELAASQGVPLACADGEVIPLADSSVGLVAALDVIEHLDDDLRALREFHRVLQPEGFLLVTVPSYRFLWSEHDEALKHRRRYVASELHAKLTCCGFQVLKRSYAVFFAFFPIFFYRLFRGLFPKDPLAPRASYIMLPSVLNNLLIVSLQVEAGMMRVMDIPLGTSVVMLAQKVS